MARLRWHKVLPNERTPFDGSGIASPSRRLPDEPLVDENSVEAECESHDIGRAGARIIAEAYLRSKSRNGDKSFHVRVMSRYDELQARRPLIYGFSPERLSTCWIAYVAHEARGTCSNRVILIDNRTGLVVLDGLANDEG